MADRIHNRIKVLIREHASDEYVEDVTPDLIQASWTFKRHGGVEQISVCLARTTPGLSGFTCPIVEIWCQDADNSWIMVAAGHAIRLYPMRVAGKDPMLTIEAVGYLQQLRWCYIAAKTWEDTTLDAIVEDIIDNTVAGDTDISRWTAKTTAGAGTTVTRFEFEGFAYDAIVHLAEAQGGVEWGVKPQLIAGTWYPAKFYFVDTTSDVNQHFFASDMSSIEYEYNIGRVRNNLIMRGDYQTDDGDVENSTDEDSTSQTDYGKRTEIINNPYIDNPTDAADYLGKIEAVLKDPGKSLGFTIHSKGVGDRLEVNTPVGVSHVWDIFSDANSQDWYFNAVTYVAKQDGWLDMYISLGEKLGVRQIYPPSQPAGSGIYNGMPTYGRGAWGSVPGLDPNRRTQRGWYRTKEDWKIIDEINKRRGK